MSLGVGVIDADLELKSLKQTNSTVARIQPDEYRARIKKAQTIMCEEGVELCFLNAGSNLAYFTGIEWTASERLMGCILPCEGPLCYLAPKFEYGTLKDGLKIPGKIYCWEEHENPYQLFSKVAAAINHSYSNIGIDESTPFFISEGLRNTCKDKTLVDAKSITAGCRMQKSKNELQILQHAKNITLSVQRSAARILREGITTAEVTNFINTAHKTIGAAQGSFFCIVLFGEDTAFPHGVAQPKNLEDGDMVLIDTGCEIYGYHSDITRSYVFGVPSSRQREIWNLEKLAQASSFEAAQLGTECGKVDRAARKIIENGGFGPNYELPGLPHRTGHGIGLDIHEWPYLVQNDQTILEEGMCFSNEPMISIPGEFGVRLEDHFYMSEDGPRWFTQPSYSIDDPFGYGVRA